jgi:cell division protein FtsL
MLLILTVFGLLLFLYLTEVSQGTSTAFDIETMEVQYQQLQERNQELERELAELESPHHVLEFAAAHGMTPRIEAEHVLIRPTAEAGQ